MPSLAGNFFCASPSYSARRGLALRGWRTVYSTFGICVEKLSRETLSTRGAYSEEG